MEIKLEIIIPLLTLQGCKKLVILDRALLPERERERKRERGKGRRGHCRTGSYYLFDFSFYSSFKGFFFIFCLFYLFIYF